MRNLFKLSWLALVLVVLFAAGCGSGKDSSASSPNPNARAYISKAGHVMFGWDASKLDIRVTEDQGQLAKAGIDNALLFVAGTSMSPGNEGELYYVVTKNAPENLPETEEEWVAYGEQQARGLRGHVTVRYVDRGVMGGYSTDVTRGTTRVCTYRLTDYTREYIYIFKAPKASWEEDTLELRQFGDGILPTP